MHTKHHHSHWKFLCKGWSKSTVCMLRMCEQRYLLAKHKNTCAGSSRPVDRAQNKVGTLKLREVTLVTCVWHTHVIFWGKKPKKNQKNEYKKVFCYINWSQNQAGTLFRSINPPPECSGPSVRSISRERSSEIRILNCHSGKCWLHSPFCCATWSDNTAAISWDWKQPEIAHGQIRTVRGCRIVSIFACWPGKLQQFWQCMVEPVLPGFGTKKAVFSSVKSRI